MVTTILEEKNARFALGKLLERLSETEKRDNKATLNEWEVKAVSEILRTHLSG